MQPLRLAFMGSPAFAVPALQALHRAGHDIAAVYSQPPRPAGRGQRLTPCPVHQAAEALGLPVRTPARLRRDTQAQEDFAALGLDVAVVAAYGLILPPAMLAAPRRGCLNIHASLLPRWRGAAPIQAAILAGDAETGITIMQMEAGLDTGPMLTAAALPIGPATTTPELHDALAQLGARLVLDMLAQDPMPRAQPEQGVTYAPKLLREDGRLDWNAPAASLDRRIRALNPWPGTYTQFGPSIPPSILKVLTARVEAGSGAPGTVLDDGLLIGCGDGAIRLLRVQLPGRAALPAEEFLRGVAVVPGTILG